MRRRFVLPALLLAALPHFAPAQAADPLPSQDELQKMLDDKDWPGLLAGTSRVLQLRGPATASYRRTAVWLMKAEALLHSNQFLPAGQAFASAAAEKDAGDDERDLALSTAMLLKHSDRKGYQPKPTRTQQSPKLYDVVDPDSRRDAIAAFFAEELSDLPARVEAQKTSTNAGPITQLAKKIAELRPLARTVDRNTDKLDEFEKTLGHNYAMKIALWSDTNSKRLDELLKLSQQTTIDRYTDAKGVMRTRTTLRGLMPQEQTEIRDMEKQAKAYADGEQQIEAAFAPPGRDAISPAQKSIQSLYDQAQSTRRTAMMQR